MSPAEELEELIAGWQVEAIDEAGLRRLEALLLADPAARTTFVERCREDVALRSLCRMSAAEAEPGEDTRRLIAAASSRPRLPTARRRRSGTGGTGRTVRPSGPNRAPATRRTVRRTRRARPAPTTALAIGGAALALLLVLVVALVGRGGQPTAPAPEVVAAPVEQVPREPRVVARLTALAGDAEFYREEDVRSAHVGQGLRSGDRLLLAAGATASVTLDDGTRFELAAGADVLAMGGDQGFTLLLAAGQTAATVARQAAGRTVAIRTPEGTVTVVGTAFTVDARRVVTRVAVREGLVRAAAHSGEHLMVGAGEVALIRDGRVEYERPAVTRPQPAVPVVEPAARPEPAAPEPPAIAGGVHDFSLIDADRNEIVGQPFDPIAEGAVVDRAALGLRGLNLRANTTGPVFAVRFWIDGEFTMREQYEPFTLVGDITDRGDFRIWDPAPGTYVIEAQGYRDFDARDPVGERARLTITVR